MTTGNHKHTGARKNSPTKAKPTHCFLVKLSGKLVVSGSLLLIAALCTHYDSAGGVLVQTPTDTAAIANRSTFFKCSQFNNKTTEPTWYHYPLDRYRRDRQDVYDDRRIRDKYKDRFSIEKNITSGTFNLLVQRPEPTDAGRYECVEDPLAKDKGASAELTVLDSNLVCESDKDLNEIVGPTECSKPIAPDQLQLSCSVTYSGNFPPQMEWIKVGSELDCHKTKCSVRGNRVMCNTTLKANFHMDGSVYICQIATAEQYNCSLTVNQTIYTFSNTSVKTITKTEEAFCSANTSMDLPCSYKWYTGSKTEQLGQRLKTVNPGIYRCEAECTIRNETCAFTATVISVSEPGTWNRKLLGLSVLLIIPLSVFVAVSMYCLRKRKRDRSAKKTAVHVCDLRPETGQEPEHEFELHGLLTTQRNETDEVSLDNAIQTAFKQARPIRKGLSGEIRGPGQHKVEDIQCDCAYEKIECYIGQQAVANELEMSETKKTVFDNGLKWMALNHDNLIKFYDVVSQSSAIYIVMEHSAGESVRETLQKRTEDLPMTEVMDWATQIGQGISHLHEKGIVHKNIKSSQIFIVESTDMEKTLKIACFNLFGDDSINDDSSSFQKIDYLPPEAFTGSNISKMYDIWSFGIVIWEMLTRNEPYKGMAGIKMMQDICKGAKELKIPNSCPKNLKNILEGCRSVEPSNRPSFSEILQFLKMEKTMAMTKEHIDILQANRVMFVENLIFSEEFISVLLADGILTPSLIEMIQTQKTQSEKVQELVFTLTKRGDEAYIVFLHALIESRQDHLAKCLDPVIAEQLSEERDQKVRERSRPTLVEVQSSFDIRGQPPDCSEDESDTVWYDKLFCSDTKELGFELKQMTQDRQKRIVKMMNTKEAYPLTKKDGCFGRAVIINNMHYHMFAPRPGSDVDCEQLKKLFEQLHFESVVHSDLTAKEMENILMDERNNQKHHEYSCFVLCILAHGSENKVCGVDAYETSGSIHIPWITSLFSAINCPGLAGKPKLFFIEASQGGKAMVAVALSKAKAIGNYDIVYDARSDEGCHGNAARVNHSRPWSETASRQPISEESFSHPLHTPEVADVLVAYSTVPGYTSWRHAHFGTWFIRCLVYVILNNACEDHIPDMLTQVAFIISQFKVTAKGIYAVQVPQVVSTLRKKVYFMP